MLGFTRFEGIWRCVIRDFLDAILFNYKLSRVIAGLTYHGFALVFECTHSSEIFSMFWTCFVYKSFQVGAGLNNFD